MTKRDKILGGLLGAAVGETMGAATETWTTDMIKKEYGGYVKEIKKPPVSTNAMGKTPAGQVTGGFSFAYLAAEQIIRQGGKITEDIGIKALAEWLKHPQYHIYTGPTMKKAIQRFQGVPVEDRHPFLTCNHHNATNEAATRSFIFGLFDAGNADQAIDDAILAYRGVHGNVMALSGACAVAASAARAMEEGANYYDVLMAGAYGAREGYDRAYDLGIQPASGALVERRIQMAVEIGVRFQDDFDKAMSEIEQCIGNGLPANESVPAAFGCVAATKGDPLKAVWMGVNIGNDTDAIAAIAGGIAGTLSGCGAYRESDLTLIDSVNGYDLRGLAGDISALKI